MCVPDPAGPAPTQPPFADAGEARQGSRKPAPNPSAVRASMAGRADLLDQPSATAEYLVVDTETNGRGGDLCELTEVGAVLVGGGELHDTSSRSWPSSDPCRAASSG